MALSATRARQLPSQLAEVMLSLFDRDAGDGAAEAIGVVAASLFTKLLDILSP